MTVCDLKKMTTCELKACAYDFIYALEQAQQGLKVVNQILAERQVVQQELDSPQKLDSPQPGLVS